MGGKHGRACLELKDGLLSPRLLQEPGGGGGAAGGGGGSEEAAAAAVPAAAGIVEGAGAAAAAATTGPAQQQLTLHKRFFCFFALILVFPCNIQHSMVIVSPSRYSSGSSCSRWARCCCRSRCH